MHEFTVKQIFTMSATLLLTFTFLYINQERSVQTRCTVTVGCAGFLTGLKAATRSPVSPAAPDRREWRENCCSQRPETPSSAQVRETEFTVTERKSVSVRIQLDSLLSLRSCGSVRVGEMQSVFVKPLPESRPVPQRPCTSVQVQLPAGLQGTEYILLKYYRFNVWRIYVT